MAKVLSKSRRLLSKLVHNPLVDLTIGTILLVSGLWEAWETLPDDVASANLRGVHGVIILGLATCLRAIADMFAGLEFMDEAEYVESKSKKP